MATAFSPKGVHQRAREALLASNWWAAAIRGVIAILIGAFAIFAPAATLIALVMIFAAYSLVDGVFAIVLAIRGARKHERWGWLAFNGVVSIAAAAIAVLFPAPTIVAFAILFAVWAIVSGSASVAAGVEPRQIARPLVADPAAASSPSSSAFGPSSTSRLDARAVLHRRLPGSLRRLHPARARLSAARTEGRARLPTIQRISTAQGAAGGTHHG